MTLNASSSLETGEKKKKREGIRKIYLLSTVVVYSQWNQACLKLKSSEIRLWKDIILLTGYRELRFLPKAPELNTYNEVGSFGEKKLCGSGRCPKTFLSMEPVSFL